MSPHQDIYKPVSPDQRVFRGETVTLTCDIQRAGNIQWTYSWFRDASVIRDVTERVYSITSDESYSEYSCRGERSDSQRSHISAAVTLTVSEPVVKVSPDQRVFRGETVTLTCDIQTAGHMHWFRDASVIRDVTERVYSITSDESYSEYSCRGERSDSQKSHTSAAVTLTVSERPKPALRETNVSSWSYSWNKDDSVIHVSQSQEYRISSVNESHTGHYSCAGNETQGSRYSHTSDKVTLTVSGESLYICLSL
uniref:Ig-like domain-containing protein n=1 Tax=Sinocyclocheilus grahami TaxID=75366 RepID=A0A672LSH3_SINGR